MKLIIFLTLIVTLAAECKAKEVVCYVMTDNDISSKIDKSLCTMIMLSFGTVDANGNIGLPANFASYKALKTTNTKVLLALGGAITGKAAFSAIAASATVRATFAQNCLNVVQSNGLDGIDIDWEFPDSSERANFVALHQAVKNKLGSSYLLTTAVSVGKWLLETNNVYDIPGLSATVNFIHLMAYDMHMDEDWDLSAGVNFNAPISANSGDSVNKGIDYWLKGGAPASKLTLGVPFYGRTYQLSDPAKTAPGSPFLMFYQRQDSYKPSYNVYCSRIASSSWTKKRDSFTLCPYMYSGSQWTSYEDEQSIIEKAKLANFYNLGGVMTWALNHDDYDGVCSSCKWPLLKALNSGIGRAASCSGSVPVVVTTTTTQKTTTTTKSSSGTGTITTCTSTGYFAYPGDCTKYYQCAWVGYAPYIMTCGSGLKWNNQAKYCDWNCVA